MYKIKPIKNPSTDERGDHRIPPLPEDLLEINDFREKEYVISSGVWAQRGYSFSGRNLIIMHLMAGLNGLSRYLARESKRVYEAELENDSDRGCIHV